MLSPELMRFLINYNSESEFDRESQADKKDLPKFIIPDSGKIRKDYGFFYRLLLIFLAS